MPQINWINQLLVSFAQSLMACRALTYMLEALPQSAAVMGDAIPVLIDKVTLDYYVHSHATDSVLLPYRVIFQ